ncbi:hypothetical protein J6590_026326 [Homalodisca vitripennis]|nr:hypothetical protein J6590_026326 [Homalodisca vitripennis]
MVCVAGAEKIGLIRAGKSITTGSLSLRSFCRPNLESDRRQCSRWRRELLQSDDYLPSRAKNPTSAEEKPLDGTISVHRQNISRREPMDRGGISITERRSLQVQEALTLDREVGRYSASLSRQLAAAAAATTTVHSLLSARGLSNKIPPDSHNGSSKRQATRITCMYNDMLMSRKCLPHKATPLCQGRRVERSTDIPAAIRYQLDDRHWLCKKK